MEEHQGDLQQDFSARNRSQAFLLRFDFQDSHRCCRGVFHHKHDFAENKDEKAAANVEITE